MRLDEFYDKSRDGYPAIRNLRSNALAETDTQTFNRRSTAATTFLRSFTFGFVRQLDAVAARLLARALGPMMMMMIW